MSEQGENTQTQAETKTQTPAPAATPQLDEGKIVAEVSKQVAASATKAVEQKIKETFARLGGAEDKPQIDPITMKLLTDPTSVFTAHAEIVEEKVQQRIYEAKQREAAHAEVHNQFVEDMPEIKDHMGYVDLEYERVSRDQPKLSEKEKIDLSYKNVAKKLNLKSLSAEEKKTRAREAFIPMGGGGYFAQTAEESRSSNMDFIKARREALRGPRTKISRADRLASNGGK